MRNWFLIDNISQSIFMLLTKLHFWNYAYSSCITIDEFISENTLYRIYLKNPDTLGPYHTYPETWLSQFYYL